MKSFKAGIECTLKNFLFCPNNGETPRLAGIEEKVRGRLMEYGVDEDVITEVF